MVNSMNVVAMRQLFGKYEPKDEPAGPGNVEAPMSLPPLNKALFKNKQVRKVLIRYAIYVCLSFLPVMFAGIGLSVSDPSAAAKTAIYLITLIIAFSAIGYSTWKSFKQIVKIHLENEETASLASSPPIQVGTAVDAFNSDQRYYESQGQQESMESSHTEIHQSAVNNQATTANDGRILSLAPYDPNQHSSINMDMPPVSMPVPPPVAPPPPDPINMPVPQAPQAPPPPAPPMNMPAVPSPAYHYNRGSTQQPPRLGPIPGIEHDGWNAPNQALPQPPVSQKNRESHETAPSTDDDEAHIYPFGKILVNGNNHGDNRERSSSFQPPSPRCRSGPLRITNSFMSNQASAESSLASTPVIPRPQRPVQNTVERLSVFNDLKPQERGLQPASSSTAPPVDQPLPPLPGTSIDKPLPPTPKADRGPEGNVNVGKKDSYVEKWLESSTKPNYHPAKRRVAQDSMMPPVSQGTSSMDLMIPEKFADPESNNIVKKKPAPDAQMLLANGRSIYGEKSLADSNYDRGMSIMEIDDMVEGMLESSSVSASHAGGMSPSPIPAPRPPLPTKEIVNELNKVQQPAQKDEDDGFLDEDSDDDEEEEQAYKLKPVAPQPTGAPNDKKASIDFSNIAAGLAKELTHLANSRGTSMAPTENTSTADRDSFANEMMKHPAVPHNNHNQNHRPLSDITSSDDDFKADPQGADPIQLK